MRNSYYFLFACVLAPSAVAKGFPPATRDVAEYASQKYLEPAIEVLQELVTYPTVYQAGTPNRDAQPFLDMTKYLSKTAKKLGLKFKSHGDAVVISLGSSEKRFGIVTHGDVQPADPSKWKKDPFVVDRTSEPGKLIGRGTEDDKGAIATTLFAMKAVKDKNIKLSRQIELIVSYTEESDWEPFEAFLKNHPPPELNIVIDGSYPVVVAEKGWCSVHISFESAPEPKTKVPYLKSFKGGAFLSQVPEDAEAVIAQATPNLRRQLEKAARQYPKVRFTFEDHPGNELTVKAKGLSAHGAAPEDGINAVSHLATVLGNRSWPATTASQAIIFIKELIGTDIYGRNFGTIAYSDPFMGPLTLNLATVAEENGKLVVGINLRRPIGKEKEVFEEEINTAVLEWKKHHPDAIAAELKTYVGKPHFQKDAPHVQKLLDIFSFFSGIPDPKPISIGGGTHARLVPHGVGFGPSMPNSVYSGHTEHEFVTLEQLQLNLKMTTAAIIELAQK